MNPIYTDESDLSNPSNFRAIKVISDQSYIFEVHATVDLQKPPSKFAMLSSLLTLGKSTDYIEIPSGYSVVGVYGQYSETYIRNIGFIIARTSFLKNKEKYE